jgi:peptidoglycan/LPS O-acetylase OafA/YrhL
VPGFVKNIAMVFSVSLLISTASYYLVERPAMNAARRYGQRWRSTPSSAPGRLPALRSWRFVPEGDQPNAAA